MQVEQKNTEQNSSNEEGSVLGAEPALPKEKSVETIEPSVVNSETGSVDNANSLMDWFTVDITFPPLVTLIALVGLIFGIYRFWFIQREKKRLATIICASKLEILAKDCLKLSWDYGTWNEPNWYGEGNRQNNNEIAVKDPQLTDFSQIENIGTFDTDHLNKILSLETLLSRMASRFYALFEHDFPDYEEGFQARRICYAGFGVFVSELARELRNTIKASDLGGSANSIYDDIKARFPKLIVEATRHDDLKSFYELAFLPVPESYWPRQADIDAELQVLAQRKAAKELQDAQDIAALIKDSESSVGPKT